MGECQIEGPCTSQNNVVSNTIKHMTVSGTYSGVYFNTLEFKIFKLIGVGGRVHEK